MEKAPIGDVIIVPLPGEANVSDDRNVVTFEGKEKLKGHILHGVGWKLESETILVAHDWKWNAIWHCQLDNMNNTEEQAHVLCYFLNKVGGFMAIIKEKDGHFKFMLLSKAEVCYFVGAKSVPAEIVLSGTSPYTVTYFEGDVEIGSSAVEWADKCIEYSLWQCTGVEFHN